MKKERFFFILKVLALCPFSVLEISFMKHFIGYRNPLVVSGAVLTVVLGWCIALFLCLLIRQRKWLLIAGCIAAVLFTPLMEVLDTLIMWRSLHSLGDYIVSWLCNDFFGGLIVYNQIPRILGVILLKMIVDDIQQWRKSKRITQNAEPAGERS